MEKTGTAYSKRNKHESRPVQTGRLSVLRGGRSKPSTFFPPSNLRNLLYLITVERTSGNVVISGFEYTYDDLSRIAEEKILAGAVKVCYTYDALSRVTGRTVRRLSDNSVVSSESFTYDAAGNVTGASGSTVTKYVYGRGLIGEETGSAFKTYHFDFRGSTVAVTNASGTVTDTFAYDTYGKLLSRTGTSAILFGFLMQI